MTERPTDWARARRAMVNSQLRTVGVSDLRVLGRFDAVERHLFVPDDALGLAYADAIVPLGDGRALNPPATSAHLIQAAEPRASDKALLIAADARYAAAILGPLVGELFTLSGLDPAPLVDGLPEHAPYDLIVVDGGIERVPDALVDQLCDGGRLTAGLIERGIGRLTIGIKVGGVLSQRAFTEATVAELPTFRTPTEFVF